MLGYDVLRKALKDWFHDYFSGSGKTTKTYGNTSTVGGIRLYNDGAGSITVYAYQEDKDSTVNADSVVAAKNLYVADNTQFEVGDKIIINADNATSEVGVVASKATGKVVTVSNLSYGHWGTKVAETVSIITPKTVVDTDSALGQKVLKVTATAGFTTGVIGIIGKGTAREELFEVDSVTTDDYITTVANLVHTHTSVQGDAVDIFKADDTTVDEVCLTGQKVLKTAATANWATTDFAYVNYGGANGTTKELCEVDTIQAGVSLTMIGNLTNRHFPVWVAESVRKYNNSYVVAQGDSALTVYFTKLFGLTVSTAVAFRCLVFKD